VAENPADVRVVVQGDRRAVLVLPDPRRRRRSCTSRAQPGSPPFSGAAPLRAGHGADGMPLWRPAPGTTGLGMLRDLRDVSGQLPRSAVDHEPCPRLDDTPGSRGSVRCRFMSDPVATYRTMGLVLADEPRTNDQKA
jgi:hypothetical protein